MRFAFTLIVISSLLTTAACAGQEESYLDELTGQTGEKYEKAQGYAEACDGGGMPACNSLAELYSDGAAGLPRQPAKACNLWLQACTKAHEPSCRSAQRCLYQPTTEDSDRRELIRIADERCPEGQRGWCGSMSQCITQGICKPQTDAHCRLVDGCSGMGFCTVSNGACIATTDKDCEAARTCRDEGKCSAIDGQCGYGKTADCQRSPSCAQNGLCSFADGRCIAASDADCKPSQACQARAECWAKSGACYDRDKQCKESNNCAEMGLCRSNTEGNGCVAGSTDDCVKSKICRTIGQCSLGTDGLCSATTERECRDSEACAKHNRCYLNEIGGCHAIVSEEEKQGLVIREGGLVWLAKPRPGVDTTCLTLVLKQALPQRPRDV